MMMLARVSRLFLIVSTLFVVQCCFVAYGQNGGNKTWECGEFQLIPHADGSADIVVFDEVFKGRHDLVKFDKVFAWGENSELQIYISPNGLGRLYDFTDVPSGKKTSSKLTLSCH